MIRSSRFVLSLIGLTLGLVWWALDPPKLSAVSGDRAAIIALFFTTSLALVGCLTFRGSAIRRWIIVSTALAGAVAAVTISVCGELAPPDSPFDGDGIRLWWWGLGSFVFLYVAVPFAQIFQESGKLRFPYPQLFRHSWNNFFIGFVAAIFVGISWALLGVWGALFQLVNISFFSDLFGSKPFIYLCSFTMSGFGLALGRESEAVISTLRRVSLKIAQTLLPFVGFVALLFTLTLPFTGLAPLWKTGDATPLVLGLLAFFTLFLNGVFEEGESTQSYPGWLLTALRVAIVTMPVFSGIALYGTTIRIEQYGLTPDRVFALIFASIASFYAAGYALASIWNRGKWMELIRPINVGMALVLAATAVLVQLPVLDPMRLSAENQLSRLLDERVTAKDFDFATLRFRLGHHGWNALEMLASVDQHPERDDIRMRIAQVNEADNFWNARSKTRQEKEEPTPLNFSVSPPGLYVPPALRESLVSGGWGDRCPSHTDCLLISVDFDSDGTPAYCLLAGSLLSGSSVCFAKLGDRFVYVGRISYRGPGPAPPLSDLRETTPTELRHSPYDDLVLPGGEGVLEFVP
jgi:hypothetical protein